MRPPDQTRKAIECDLKHLSTALQRAKENSRRRRDINAKIIQLLSELVLIYTQETYNANIKSINGKVA